MSKTIALPSGAEIPTLGLGTWQAEDEEELAGALNAALEAGYRFIDTAYIYGNEDVIGRVLKQWLDEGKVTREELFISTKLPMMGMRGEDVAHYLSQSLENLQLEYVDLYLVHTPFGVKPGGCEVWSQIKAGEVGPMALDMDTDHVAIWKAMEAELEAGRTLAIGVSNFNQRQIERILDKCTVTPHNNQIELHVFLQQPELVAFCLEKNITVTAYSPLGSRGSAWLHSAKGEDVIDLLSVPEVVEVAERHDKTAAQVLLRHQVQKGLITVPKSTNPERLRQNIDIYDFELSEEEMEILDALDRGEAGRLLDMRLINGVEDHPEYPFGSS